MEGEIQFETALPKKNVHATPNPMMAQLTPKIHGGSSGNATPRVQGVAVAPPSQTPLRDQMGINTPRIHGSTPSEFGDDFSNMGTPRHPSSVSTASSTFNQQNAVRTQLKSLFASLPKPKNDFEIVIPQVSSKDETSKTDQEVQDAEELDAVQRQRDQERKDTEFRKRSSAVKRDLPRPTKAPQLTPKDEVESLILHEMELMILHDAHKFPAPGQQPVQFDLSSYDDFDEQDLVKAAELVSEEVSKLEASMEEFKTKFIKTHEQVTKDYLFVPKPKPHYTHLPSLSDDQKVEAYSIKVETCRESMKQEALVSQKQEKKLGVLLGGYMARSQKLTKDIVSTFEDLRDARMEKQSFLKLKEMENVALPYRLERARREYNDLLMKDRDKQELYKDLKMEEEELLAWIQAHS
jgi:pre-mRNA-splicing factor CDC5/CEF1